MPAHNHRGNIVVSTGYLNERANALQQQIADEMAGSGWRGENWDPDEQGYDEAYGPRDRRKGANPMSAHDYSTEERANERRVQGQN